MRSPKTCEFCGVVYHAWRHHKHRFCSRACYRKWQSIYQTGKHYSSEVLASRRNRYESWYTPHFDLSDDQFAYIAGLIDAEGTVKCFMTNKVSQCYGVRVSITNTNHAVLDVIKEWLGFGNIYLHKHDKETDAHFGDKPVYDWKNQVTSLSEKLLQRIAPWLHVKRAVAEQILGIVITPRISWAYTAGFFDGEGHVENKEFKFTQKDRCVLDALQEFMGFGYVYKRKDEDVHNLNVTSYRNLLHFSEHVIPYSIIKKDELSEAQQFVQAKMM